MMFLGLRILGNICCEHKMLLNKIRNIFCLPDTKFVSATNVAHASKRGNICVDNNVSATICPRLPYQSNRSSNIPPGNPPGIWIFGKFFVQIPPSPGRKAVQMPPPSGKLPDYCLNFSEASMMLLKLCMFKHGLLDNTRSYMPRDSGRQR